MDEAEKLKSSARLLARDLRYDPHFVNVWPVWVDGTPTLAVTAVVGFEIDRTRPIPKEFDGYKVRAIWRYPSGYIGGDLKHHKELLWRGIRL